MSSALSHSRPILYGDLERWALIQADSIMLLRSFPDSSVDAVVTDPPYAIGFDGEDWDGGGLASPLGFQSFSADWAAEVRRVLKPGGHVLAFGSPRTFHRMVAGCEDVGLEIRDMLLWLHGRGVPKSRVLPGGISTTLKPAYEPILLARAPLAEHTAQANIAMYGTGGMNIDATRVPRPDGTAYWPSHVVLSHEEECGAARADCGAGVADGGGTRTNSGGTTAHCGPDGADRGVDVARSGAEWCVEGCAVALVSHLGGLGLQSATRLFYVGKASQAEREAGLDALPHRTKQIFSSRPALAVARANVHPTVKPLDVMRWLIRLVVPVGGLVLDPFTGSGSTGCAAVLEGRRFIGIEREARYLPIARARLAHWTRQAEIASEAAPHSRGTGGPRSSQAGTGDVDSSKATTSKEVPEEARNE